ncbi:hypothetical protein AK89_03865 [Enterococcus mundtii CRL35]|nr:hypothetical protein AK89_03865 [Enterococcus mundtii CRL35]
MESNSITLKIKFKIPFHWYLFKIKFQSLFNVNLATRTLEWFSSDFKENQSKYVKVDVHQR